MNRVKDENKDLPTFPRCVIGHAPNSALEGTAVERCLTDPHLGYFAWTISSFLSSDVRPASETCKTDVGYYGILIYRSISVLCLVKPHDFEQCGIIASLIEGEDGCVIHESGISP